MKQDQTCKTVERKGPYFVVNMAGRKHEGFIHRTHKPTLLHPTLASAFAEAQRMALAHCAGDYYVFEAIGAVKSPRTHRPPKPV